MVRLKISIVESGNEEGGAGVNLMRFRPSNRDNGWVAASGGPSVAVHLQGLIAGRDGIVQIQGERLCEKSICFDEIELREEN